MLLEKRSTELRCSHTERLNALARFRLGIGLIFAHAPDPAAGRVAHPCPWPDPPAGSSQCPAARDVGRGAPVVRLALSDLRLPQVVCNP